PRPCPWSLARYPGRRPRRRLRFAAGQTGPSVAERTRAGLADPGDGWELGADLGHLHRPRADVQGGEIRVRRSKWVVLARSAAGEATAHHTRAPAAHNTH